MHGAGRYAPSPTGELHVGNLRTAVLAWLFARSTGRRFLLRIEDLDSARVRPGLAEQQCAALAALGLAFDEEPVVQSARLPAYGQALRDLADRSYECFLQPPGNRRGSFGPPRCDRCLSGNMPGPEPD
jgi:glutamyl-tRNA synthetase